MSSTCVLASSIPVLVLNNVDPSWEPQERDEASRHSRDLGAGLCACGHRVAVVDVSDGDLRRRLKGFSPHEYVVLNACEIGRAHV